MRKTQKKQAGEFMELLARAHEAVGKAVSTGKNYIAMELLEQCQEGAIQLGELVEKAEGEGCGMIPLLEDYCELVYQIYEEVRQGQGASADRISEDLQQSLIKIEKYLRDNIKTRFFHIKHPCGILLKACGKQRRKIQTAMPM